MVHGTYGWRRRRSGISRLRVIISGIGVLGVASASWFALSPQSESPPSDAATASADTFQSRILEIPLPAATGALGAGTPAAAPAVASAVGTPATLQTAQPAEHLAADASSPGIPRPLSLPARPGALPAQDDQQPAGDEALTGVAVADAASGTDAAPARGDDIARAAAASPSTSAPRGDGADMLIGFGPSRAAQHGTENDDSASLRRVSVRVKQGDSLYSILRSRGIGGAAVPALLAVDDHGDDLKRIHPGQSLELHVDRAGLLQRMDYRIDELTTVSYRREGDGFDSQLQQLPVERRKAQVSGEIQTSLFLDGQRAGLTDRVIMQMAQIFGWDIDFALDLRVGDRFNIVYEELVLNGRKLRDGDILAAEFISQGQVYRAVRFIDPQGNSSYYTPDGMSMRKAFLRTPVKFARISSRFNLSRRHPILHKIRAHRGVDYAAPTGTPIKAAGEGRVEFLGRKGGYGKTIVLRHGSDYTTLYAHMNGFARGLKQGATVRQGQTIGYVGKSGLATGPHLHYEFRVRGKHKDPLKVTLPKALPIDPKMRRAFREQTHKLVAMLDFYRGSSVAMR